MIREFEPSILSKIPKRVRYGAYAGITAVAGLAAAACGGGNKGQVEGASTSAVNSEPTAGVVASPTVEPTPTAEVVCTSEKRIQLAAKMDQIIAEVETPGDYYPKFWQNLQDNFHSGKTESSVEGGVLEIRDAIANGDFKVALKMMRAKEVDATGRTLSTTNSFFIGVIQAPLLLSDKRTTEPIEKWTIQEVKDADPQGLFINQGNFSIFTGYGTAAARKNALRQFMQLGNELANLNCR